MGPNNNEAPQNNEGGDAEPGEDGNSSILSSLRKRIRLGRERHMEVGILGLTHCVIQSAFKTFISRILAPLLSRPLKPIWNCHWRSTSAWGLFYRNVLSNIFAKCRFWKQYEENSSPNDKARKALLRVVRRHLTPPPSSTNVERLFSYGGLVATDHRSSLSAEKLDQILFLRENVLMANFDLGWIWCQFCKYFQSQWVLNK